MTSLVSGDQPDKEGSPTPAQPGAEVAQPAGAEQKLEQLTGPANAAAMVIPGSEVVMLGDQAALVVTTEQLDGIRTGKLTPAALMDLAHEGHMLLIERRLLEGGGAAMLDGLAREVLPLLQRNPRADTTIVL